MNNNYDIIILGGGLVGASLALALSRGAQRVALLEHRPPRLDGLAQPDDWDARVYAISPANRRFLAELDAWPEMERVGTVAGMDVRGDAGGRIEFDAAASGADALAWIVENRWLLAAIWRRLADAGVDIVTPAEAVALHTDARAARLTLADGREFVAKLVVGCDGANSWLRQQKQIGASVDPYGHSGVVAAPASPRSPTSRSPTSPASSTTATSPANGSVAMRCWPTCHCRSGGCRWCGRPPRRTNCWR